MSAHHGNTIAAWAAVTLALLGVMIGGIGLMAGSMLWFWIGIILMPIGVVVGMVLSRMGYGS